MPGLLDLNDVGIIAFGAIALLLFRRFRAVPRTASLPLYARIGAAALIAAHVLVLAGIQPVALYFTPIAWTGYILWADGAVFALRGRSPLKTAPGEFAALALCSVPLWLIFEAYNLRLQNWLYVGLPQNWIARQVGYGWAFATIWPAIFETATLLRALGWHAEETKERKEPQEPHLPQRSGTAILSLIAGGLCLIVPLLLPARPASYLFGAVWLGFIFLLEPLNDRWGRESLWRDLRHGSRARLAALLWAGLVCGVFWEFWNYWAAARWVYTVPILPEWRIFAMPVLGYLGFPPFAVECFSMFAFAAPLLERVAGKRRSGKGFTWQVLQL